MSRAGKGAGQSPGSRWVALEAGSLELPGLLSQLQRVMHNLRSDLMVTYLLTPLHSKSSLLVTTP